MASQADARFARLKTDPRFRRPKQKQLKVELDERFRDVLESEEFGGKGKGKGKGKAADVKVDKRGRPLTGSHHQDQLKRFYRLRSPSPAEGSTSQAGFVDYARGEGYLSSSGSEDDEASEAESEASEGELELGGKKKVSFRPGYESSDDDSDSEASGSHLNVDLSEDEAGPSAFPEEEEGDDEGDDGEAEEDDGPTTDPTNRIAAVNLDWDNLRASDLFAVFNSFLKETGRKVKGAKDTRGIGKLVFVKIYPSEFGKERMKREEMEGPGGGVFLVRPGAKGKQRSNRKGGIVLQEELDEGEPDDLDDIAEGSSSDVGQEDDVSDSEADDQDSDVGDGESLDGSGHPNSGDGDEEEEEEDDEDDGDDEDIEEGDDDGSDGLPSAGLANGEGEVSDVSSDAGSEDIDMDQLRQYQLERLRYYYAVATFSTVAAAEHVMDECNGTEFERTANVFDLTFVPEGMEFADEDLHDEASKEPKGYKGTDFVTDALRHSKVKLTWDQDDPNRSKLTRKAMTREEIEEQDFRNLVAASDDSGSSSDEEEAADREVDALLAAGKTANKSNGVDTKSKKAKAKERKEKLRALLLAGNEEDGDIWGKAGTVYDDMKDDDEANGKDDVEITFRPALAAGAELADDNLTSLERYQMRMKERKSRKKEKSEMRRGMKESDGEDGDGSAVKSKSGKKSQGEDEFFGEDSEEEHAPVAPAKNGTAVKKTKTAESAKPVAQAASTGRSDKPIKADKPALDVHEDLQGAMDKEHFSMKDIIKDEKSGGKKKRKRASQAKKEARAEALGRTREAELGQQGWRIDVKDPRFKALHEEADFAIDPSNPHFTKTTAMKDLLAERARVRGNKSNNDNPAAAPLERRNEPVANGIVGGPKERDLSALVQSVKRKAELNGGSGQIKSGRKRHRK